jgi:hypothetical protein
MRIVNKQSPSIQPKRHPAQFADAEIAHLEMIVGLFTRNDDCWLILGLSWRYWRKRVEEIGQAFDLVPVQKRRIAALLGLLDDH